MPTSIQVLLALSATAMSDVGTRMFLPQTGKTAHVSRIGIIIRRRT